MLLYIIGILLGSHIIQPQNGAKKDNEVIRQKLQILGGLQKE